MSRCVANNNNNSPFSSLSLSSPGKCSTITHLFPLLYSSVSVSCLESCNHSIYYLKLKRNLQTPSTRFGVRGSGLKIDPRETPSRRCLLAGRQAFLLVSSLWRTSSNEGNNNFRGINFRCSVVARPLLGNVKMLAGLQSSPSTSLLLSSSLNAKLHL